MKKEVTPMKGVSAKNKRGEWVPVIEEPYTYLFRLECGCGKRFFTRTRYDEHCALKHILAYE